MEQLKSSVSKVSYNLQVICRLRARLDKTCEKLPFDEETTAVYVGIKSGDSKD